ncbi:pimeloyl-ACP methyl ester carboxylesterase [Thermocatellispora tengchongensis]|uniref:Pimeloyl-ACP methyl ester carboxylesterase n=1 Tax=Thermocatellispora tengchongensis TaxID=1073253 RepID=A0A840PG40_9ACTN|nr:alpha/beta hydrolase [Thermocatellispora tengchongensis]MBB5136913.1 pimeloyl-ACP methyl ester carboxylesterase [Thermocatellispora tengchongensis]
MPYAVSQSVEIYYETAGDPSGAPLVLVQGFGAQLIAWRKEFCALLVAEGFRVIRLDHRDVGRSGRCGGPEDLDGGYELTDMAGDVLCVLDALGVERAHLLGHSMGGMIGQVLALDHPRRLLSLAMLATIPGQDPAYLLDDPTPALSVVQPRLSREEAIEASVAVQRHYAVAGRPWDEAWVREAAGIAYDRGYAPDGLPRQWAALLRARDRLERLREVTLPTVIMHGRDDAVLHWRAAVDMATAIEGAGLHLYPGMGHDLPREFWADVVAAVTRNARRC